MPDAEAPELRIGVRFALALDAGELFADARAVEAAGADSIWVYANDADPYVLLAALAACTWRVRLVAAGATINSGRATCEALAGGRLVTAEDLKETWATVPFPSSRDEWRRMRQAALNRGAAGIVIPNDPRLIDLLRNPDVDDDRSDLNIAVG